MLFCIRFNRSDSYCKNDMKRENHNDAPCPEKNIQSYYYD
ncbi:hypothetical protein SAMN04488090_0867 [Siphonobacter aquaeclarae]|uniref:Uncharacterized protein n=1 Tax=Siphonobacter aquaeclarae TaxID=563176 RepID=A0A1G9K395_9BACT|nr:hypothetical protein SAMN04488090_0867 [Siphonobacter aquaeclarae]